MEYSHQHLAAVMHAIKSRYAVRPSFLVLNPQDRHALEAYWGQSRIDTLMLDGQPVTVLDHTPTLAVVTLLPFFVLPGQVESAKDIYDQLVGFSFTQIPRFFRAKDGEEVHAAHAYLEALVADQLRRNPFPIIPRDTNYETYHLRNLIRKNS